MFLKVFFSVNMWYQAANTASTDAQLETAQLRDRNAQLIGQLLALGVDPVGITTTERLNHSAPRVASWTSPAASASAAASVTAASAHGRHDGRGQASFPGGTRVPVKDIHAQSG